MRTLEDRLQASSTETGEPRPCSPLPPGGRRQNYFRDSFFSAMFHVYGPDAEISSDWIHKYLLGVPW